jgi:putative transposase
MHGALICGRRFRSFNIVDKFHREALSIATDLNLPARLIVRVIERIAANRGYPGLLRIDNGAEFISLTPAEWKKCMRQNWNLSSQENRIRMNLLNVLSGHTA